jgi:hypothetical protein
MIKNYPNHFKTFSAAIFLLVCQLAVAQSNQSLSIKDFAIWGGSSPAGVFLKDEGVFLKEGAIIKGNIGSNQQVLIKEKLLLFGSIYSGNGVSLKENTIIWGDIYAWNSSPAYINPAIFGKEKSLFFGNLTANGKINLKNDGGSNISLIRGSVSVPAPTSVNYSGPRPNKGINNTVNLPSLPSIPNNTPFDNKAGTQNITSTRKIAPGAYGKLEIKGDRTVTFDGPGNYIFSEINCTGKNQLVFDFKNVANGVINIFVVKNINLGSITVKPVNGNNNSRVFTEVHGKGDSKNGIAFDVDASGKLGTGVFAWLGNVWAPNGGISVKGCKTSSLPHIKGALWSGTKVDLNENVVLTYEAPAAANLNYVVPYYTPPTQGKVDAPNNIIGAELTSLTQNTGSIISIPDNQIFRFNENGNVMIEVISKTASDNVLKAQLIALGMTGVVDNGPHTFVITGFFPINLLPQLNTNPLIEYVRPLYPPINNRGQVTSQGDKTMKSDLVRERFGLDGSGVKIGVISDSYNSKAKAQDDVDQGDLPGLKSTGNESENPEPVQVVMDYGTAGKDEGRAMLQIVHDIAPKSKLAFRTGFLSAGDFAKGILELADPALPGGKCDVIVDDLSYITEPFFKDGVVAKSVDLVVGNGVTYFTSAGNFGKRSYEATFNGVTNTAAIPAPAQVHQFGSNASEVYQSILLKPGTFTIVLQWDDQIHTLGEAGVQTDLDLYLVGANGFTLFGFNRSNLSQDPFEVCPFTVKEETEAKLMIVRAAGTGNVRFKYIIFQGDATIQNFQTGTSTIVGHANSRGAISVGAMLYDSIPGLTPVWPGVASFSSRGGTFTLENNTYITRNKPDLIAPNGVNTTVNLGGAAFNDGDSYPNFFGTSASAPHAAAVGALLIQGQKKFNLQTIVTPAQIRQQLIASAGKFSYLGNNFNFEGGNGYLQADKSMLEIANARPIIDSLKAETPGGENGTDSFTVKVRGKYLTPTTQIYVNGEPVSTVISNNQTEAKAKVAPIAPGDDPAFQLFNAAKSPSREDGGLSEALFFFSKKETITVKAQNKDRKYGENNPEFTAEVLVNGVPIQQTTKTLADFKLDNGSIRFNTIATANSRSGLYGIFPERTTPLAPDDALFEKYRFIFVSGTLNVGKMPLKIIAENKSLKYGDYPGDISYRYEFDLSEGGGEGEEGGGEGEGCLECAATASQSAFLAEIKRLHKEYMAENGIIVVKGFNDDQNTLTQEDLSNMSALASFQSVINAKKYILQNGQLKAMVNTVDQNDIGNQRFILETPLSSLSNYVADPGNSALTYTDENDTKGSGFLNLKTLSKGEATATVNGQLRAMVNGQLMGMVNGEIEAVVNGQLRALVNGTDQDVDDIIFQNGQLRALVNGAWIVVPNGQLRALVNGEFASFDLAVTNGQLRAMVNGTEMPLVNGQLRAMVNGQNVSILNGQLRALINGQVMPVVNGQLVAIVNGQLRALVNGEMAVLVNGQLMAEIDGQLEEVTELTLVNGQLRALVNGQLRALVNGQLKAMVNGDVTDIDNNELVLENGQLRALVNGQLRALVNGQLKALVNGQLRALVNVEGLYAEKVIQLANGQLRALVNGTNIPIRNGQLRAMVNGQLRALVNGELMAEEEGQINFTVFENGQLKAMVNGQLKALVNGQLRAMVNGQIKSVNSYVIENGQLRAMVNGELDPWVFPNGQLKALVNGQLKALVNNFDVSGTNNNAKTLVLVDEDDLVKQSGDIGGMVSMAMITGNEAGNHKIIPAAFINENFEVTYEVGELNVSPAPLFIKTEDTTKVYGDENPVFEWSIAGTAYDETITLQEGEGPFSAATNVSPVGVYPISFNLEVTDNYTRVNEYGNLTILPKLLTVRADNKTVVQVDSAVLPALTITYDGLVGDDTEESVCVNYTKPGTTITELERQYTYSDIKINNQTSVYTAQPGEALTLTGSWYQVFVNPGNPYCPGCITQLYIGMGNGAGGNNFTYCTDVSGLGDHSGSIDRTFNAPTTEGVYYITQRSSWLYNCYDVPISHDAPSNVIAVVIVSTTPISSEDKITASVAVDLTAEPGDYPITLAGCGSYNANYNVVLENGVLSILPDPTIGGIVCDFPNSIHWQGNGNFMNNNEDFGTPVGGVTANGEPKAGSGSFSFDGTGYIDVGTGGSVSGTGDFAVSAWVKTTSSNPMVIINQREDGNINGEYMLKIGGDHYNVLYNEAYAGRAYFLIYDPFNNSAEIDLLSETLVNDGEWHFIKGERKGTTINLYVDGNLEATATTAGVVNLSSTIRTFIGYDQLAQQVLGQGCYFEGLIDDIRVEICTSSDEENGKLDCGEGINTIHWQGNGNFMNNNEDFGNPVGGVTANGEPKVGSGSFSFDGTGYIDVGTEGSVSGTGNFAVSAWVKTTSGNPMVIIQQRQTTDGQYMLKVGGRHWPNEYDESLSGKAYFMMYDFQNPENVFEVFSDTRVNDGEWHFIKAVRKGFTIELYVDNILESSLETWAIVNLNSSISTVIGRDQKDDVAYFEGLIDEIKVEICFPEIGTADAEILTVEAVIEPKAKKEIITKDLVYPNPASNTIRLQLTEDVLNINEIQVLSAMGKVNKTSARKIDDGVYELNISGIPKGIYFMRARTQSGIKTFKFVKM